MLFDFFDSGAKYTFEGLLRVQAPGIGIVYFRDIFPMNFDKPSGIR